MQVQIQIQVQAKVPMQVLVQIQIRDVKAGRCVTFHSEYESILER